MRTLRRLIKENDYKVIHIEQNSASMAMDAFVAKTCGVPVIIGHSHNTRCNVLWQHYMFRPFVNLFMTDRFACSEAAGQWLFGNRSDVKVVNNAIDTNRYLFDNQIRQSVRKELGLEGKFVVGFVGRLHNQKNPIRMLEIFKAVCDKEPLAHLILIGEGEERDAMAAKARELRIDEKVLFLGRRENVNELMMAMDVLLMPSLYEGLPVVIVEAQSSGLRCIISDKVPAPQLTGRVSILSLETSDELWASEIVKGDDFDRTKAQDMIIAGGYDISHEAKKLEQFYLGRVS